MPKRDSEDQARTSYQYVGSGEYLSGIPARDLTSADVDALSDEQRDALQNSALYKKGGS
jgi:hypothetical protein